MLKRSQLRLLSSAPSTNNRFVRPGGSSFHCLNNISLQLSELRKQWQGEHMAKKKAEAEVQA